MAQGDTAVTLNGHNSFSCACSQFPDLTEEDWLDPPAPHGSGYGDDTAPCKQATHPVTPLPFTIKEAEKIEVNEVIEREVQTRASHTDSAQTLHTIGAQNPKLSKPNPN